MKIRLAADNLSGSPRPHDEGHWFIIEIFLSVLY